MGGAARTTRRRSGRQLSVLPHLGRPRIAHPGPVMLYAGLGVLAKGPVGLVLLGVAVIVIIASTVIVRKQFAALTERAEAAFPGPLDASDGATRTSVAS